MESYGGSGKVKYTSGQLRKIKKQMKKSFKKADELKKRSERLHQGESIQADNMLDEIINDL